MTRRALVLAVLAAGAILLAGQLLAPLIAPRYIVPISALWYLALAVLCWAAFHILSHWLGHGGALVLIGLGLLTPILLTALRPPPALAVSLPCPRNWARLPTWLLRSSPLGSLRFEVGGSKVKLCYGRPAVRGRIMLGGSRVPYGQLWRTGAHEPTTLISSLPLEVAGMLVPAGRTALYTIPGPETWELFLNPATGQGVKSEYSDTSRSHELGRAILPSSSGSHVEWLTFFVVHHADGDSGRTDLVLAWERTRLRIPIRAISR